MTDTQIKIKAPRYEIIVREIDGPGEDGHGGHQREVRFVTEEFNMSQKPFGEGIKMVEGKIVPPDQIAFSLSGVTVKATDG